MKKIAMWIKKQRFVILLFLLVVAFTLLSVRTMRLGNDYWWHIKAGSYMVKNHVILNYDVFSWYATSHALPWIAHEWLCEVLLYGLKVWFGSCHPQLFCGILFFATMVTLLLVNRKKFSKNIYLSMLFFTLSLLFLTPAILPRPHMISYFFLVLTLWLLSDLAKNEDSKKVYFLPVLAILWANLHGGSSNLIYILCFVFFFIGLFDFSLGKLEMHAFSKKQQRKYLGIGILSILGLLINPQGFELLRYPYANLQDSFMLKTIAEWQASNPNQLSHISIFAYLGLLLFIILQSPKKLRLLDGILLMMFAFLALKSIRFWPYLYLTSGFVIFDYISQRPLPNPLSYTLLACFIALFLIFCIPWHPVSLSTQVVDDAFIDILKREKPQRLYNYYDYGGYLIYHDIPVFIDGRADLYSKYNYQDYYHLSMLDGHYRDILKRYQFDMFLLDKGLPLAYYLEEVDTYELVLDKGNTVLYRLKET